MRELEIHDKMNKSLIIKKIKIGDKNLNNFINEGFETADNYLKINPNVIIGKKIRGPRFDQDKKLIPYSIIGDPAHFEAIKKRNKNYSLRHFISNAISSMNSTSTSHKKDDKRGYDYIEDEKINLIYENITNEIEKNKKTPNDFMNQVPTIVKKQLQMQETRLNSKNRLLDITNDISKNLSRKIKKDPESLLINKTDEYRLKIELVENVLNKTTNAYENTIPVTNWITNLRQSHITDPPKTSYIYYGDAYNPYWVPVRERKIKSIEIIRNPLSKTKLDINKYIKNKKLTDSRYIDTSNSTHKFNSSSIFHPTTCSKNFNYTDSFNSLNTNLVTNEMMVKGKSLLECEMNITNQLTGRKIIYKKDYLNACVSGPIPASETNEKERDKNLSKLTSRMDILSSYNYNFPRKEGLIKTKLIK